VLEPLFQEGLFLEFRLNWNFPIKAQLNSVVLKGAAEAGADPGANPLFAFVKQPHALDIHPCSFKQK
jgi:hypothetical protein